MCTFLDMLNLIEYVFKTIFEMELTYKMQKRISYKSNFVHKIMFCHPLNNKSINLVIAIFLNGKTETGKKIQLIQN